MAKTFLWIEDRKGKASYTFWENLMKQLRPDVIVESKKNNSELLKAVKTMHDRFVFCDKLRIAFLFLQIFNPVAVHLFA